MPEISNEKIELKDSDYNFLVRVNFPDSMGSGSLVWDQGDLNDPTDDQVYVLTAGHVAGSRLGQAEQGSIEMFLNGEWTEVDQFVYSDVYLKEAYWPNGDIGLIRFDFEELFDKYDIDFEDLLKVPTSPIEKPDQLEFFGASITRGDEAVKYLIGEYAVKGDSIILADRIAIRGDSGGPLVATVENERYVVGVTSVSSDLINSLLEETFEVVGFANLDQSSIDFIYDVFENEERSKHFRIDDVEYTSAERWQQIEDIGKVVIVGGLAIGGLALYGGVSMLDDIMKYYDKRKKRKLNYGAGGGIPACAGR
jgi:hypothetical protein